MPGISASGFVFTPRVEERLGEDGDGGAFRGEAGEEGGAGGAADEFGAVDGGAGLVGADAFGRAPEGFGEEGGAGPRAEQGV